MRLFFILILILSTSQAGFQEFVPDRDISVTPKKSLQSSSIEKNLQRLIEQDKKIQRLLSSHKRGFIIKKKSENVMALARFKGVVLNSIIAMNVKPSKFITKIRDGKLAGSELRCMGYSFERRVSSRCDLLVWEDREYQVDVELWDLDGAEGIIADYYYLGEEKTFITSSFASFFQGVLESNTGKNKISHGMSEITENIRRKIVESGEQEIAISYVNAGKEVLVFFNQAINLEGGL